MVNTGVVPSSWLDLTILEVFSNLNNLMTLLGPSLVPHSAIATCLPKHSPQVKSSTAKSMLKMWLQRGEKLGVLGKEKVFMAEI